jgi:tetratricopeptide (TPR) repeat protein
VNTAVGKIFEASGQYEQAAGAYRKALATDNSYAPARLALIQAELNRGNREAALAEAKKAGSEMPSSPEIQLLIGEMAIRSNDAAAAIPALEKATKGLPGNADGWALLGRAYHFLRRYDEAAEAYKKAVSLSPLNIGYATTLGLVLGQAGELDEGLAVLQKVTSSPGYKDAAGWVNLGWIYRNMNRADESIAAYKKGLELDPKQEQAALGLGWAYSYTKKYDEAISAYQKAIEIDPRKPGRRQHRDRLELLLQEGHGQARAFADKASAAGRNGALGIKENIEKYEKRLASGAAQSEADMDEARQAQQAYEEPRQEDQPGERYDRLAQRPVAAQGGPGHRGRGRRRLGPRARVDDADRPELRRPHRRDQRARRARPRPPSPRCPTSTGMLRQPDYTAPVAGATPEQLDAEMKAGDYKRACATL